MGTGIRVLSTIALMLSVLLTGCAPKTMVRDTVASGMVTFNNEFATPWFLSSEDTDIMCGMGEGMGGMIYPMGPNVDVLLPMISLASGMCAYEKSLEQELRYLRAMRQNDVENAQDARTMQKRYMALSAQRQYLGYKAAVRAFGEPGEECPRLDDRNERMAYLMGLLVGLQAFQADFATGGSAGVSTDIVSKVTAGMKCIDSDEFWGLPDAIASMMDVMLAAAGDEGDKLEAGYARLQRAADVGERNGVRMVQALQAQLYAMQGKPEKAKQVIRDHVASIKRTAPNPDFKLMDLMATRTIRGISDKMWTKATGQRTPFGKLGTFWDDKPKLESGLDIDDLL